MKNTQRELNVVYRKTGTFSPLFNQRKYTKDEKTVLLHFFTNADKNVYCAKDSLSSQLWAFLIGQYSRSELSLRDRFLQLFLDAQKNYRAGKIKRKDFVSLKKLANAIRQKKFKTVKYFNDRASAFLRKWGVEYGHNSLKDADRIRFAIEGVSKYFTKIIEEPFPTIGDFQEKSTRYLCFSKEDIIIPPVLRASKYFDELKALTGDLMSAYGKYLPIIQEELKKNRVINKKSFKNEIAYEKTLQAKAFDIVRYLLPTGTSTALGASFSARTIETHISDMLSSPIEEVRLVAQSMHEEALKISPGLLSHVGENDYLIKKNKKTRRLIESLTSTWRGGEMHEGVSDSKRVSLISSDKIDNIITASIIFEYSRRNGMSFREALRSAKKMSVKDKERIITSELKDRGPFDRMPRTIQHGKIFLEILCDFGAYCDIQRHRATTKIWQGASGIHGYDYPECINLKGLEEFKSDYNVLMMRGIELFQKVVKSFPYEAQYVVTSGHLTRTTYEMHPGQLAYICELRTTPQGHYSYRKLFQEVYRVTQKKAPIFSKFIRVNQSLHGSRMKQEEKSVTKKRVLQKN